MFEYEYNDVSEKDKNDTDDEENFNHTYNGFVELSDLEAKERYHAQSKIQLQKFFGPQDMPLTVREGGIKLTKLPYDGTVQKKCIEIIEEPVQKITWAPIKTNTKISLQEIQKIEKDTPSWTKPVIKKKKVPLSFDKNNNTRPCSYAVQKQHEKNDNNGGWKTIDNRNRPNNERKKKIVFDNTGKKKSSILF